MFISQTKTTILKSCPLCAQNLQITAINGRDRLVCFACEFVHWDNPIPVTATIVPMDSGIVLVRRKYPPFVDDWCLPGGFIEAHESPELSAIREVEEETGLKIEMDRLINACAPGKNINVIIIFYLAKPATGTLTAGDDASEVGCFAANSLPKNIAFPLHKQMIDGWFIDKLK